ncbi:hypothetical protein KJ969_05610 [Patescibacteria group bacterium]|nr:hypothetical protein [Patescibacteria group bacterium]
MAKTPTILASSPDPKKAKGKGSVDDFVDVSINELMPVAVRWLLSMVPPDQYETIFQDRIKHWNLVLPLLNFFLRRAFNAPDVVDNLTTEFFAEVRREINIRAGGEDKSNRSKSEKEASAASKKVPGALLKHLLKTPNDVAKYMRIVAGKDDGEAKKIKLLLDSLPPEELAKFFAMKERAKEKFLTIFITQTKQSKLVQTIMMSLAAKMRARIDLITPGGKND